MTVVSTGTVGSRRRSDLPVGWVSVAYFRLPGSDVSTDYHGPVLAEDDAAICIEVFGSSVTLPKRSCLITRAEVSA